MTISQSLGRALAFASLALITQGCATKNYVTLSYSSEFSLVVPASELEGSTIFSADELSVKTADGQLMSGQVISHASEGITGSFPIQDYPRFLFNLKPTSSLSPEDAILFSNSASEIKHLYGENEPEQTMVGDFTTYTICGNGACLSYVVKDDFDSHILMVHALGTTKEEFTSLINGGLYADR